MDLTTTKVVVLLLLGLSKIIFGLAPLVLTRMLKKRERWLKKFVGFILCFGGGVLLSTIFVHMLKEIKETLERAAELGGLPEESEYPFPELIILMGFLLILLVETFATKFLGGHQHHGHSHGHSKENRQTYRTNGHNYGYSHNEANGNGHISNEKIMEAESGEKNGFYSSPSNSSHDHPVA